MAGGSTRTPAAGAQQRLFAPGLRVGLVVASPDILGGHAVQAACLADGLRSEGCDVRFVPINPRFPGGLRWVRRVPYLRTALNQALYLPRLLALGRVDVVHVFAASYWSFLLAPVPAILAGRALGRRVVLHYHSGEAEDHLAHWGALVHPWLRRAHVLVVPCEELRRVFARHGHVARVVPNIVDLAAFPYRERTALRPRLLSVRNLEPHYAVDATLAAFALVRARYPEATLTIAGTGSEEARLRRLAASMGAGSVRFAGRVEREDVARLYDGEDVFVNSSLVDNQPVSILEAFAAGLPVVSTGTGGIRAMVRPGDTGLLVPPRDPEAMARAVAELLEHPERAAGMARRARREVERHRWEAVRRDWSAAYAAAGRSLAQGCGAE